LVWLERAMGMFDYLICKYPLPRPEMQLCEFQTKSFENALELYEITVDGRLVRHEWERGPDASERLADRMNAKETARPSIPIDYTGEVRFYDFWPPREIDPKSQLVDFVASFDRGRVVRIEWVAS
jgi:hypothetical protein